MTPKISEHDPGDRNIMTLSDCILLHGDSAATDAHAAYVHVRAELFDLVLYDVIDAVVLRQLGFGVATGARQRQTLRARLKIGLDGRQKRQLLVHHMAPHLVHKFTTCLNYNVQHGKEVQLCFTGEAGA